MKIVKNSNFEKGGLHGGLVMEKIYFILLKHAMMKLNKVYEKMYICGENVLNLTDWN